jgi:hypothetical protein
MFVKPVLFGLLCAWREVLILRQHNEPPQIHLSPALSVPPVNFLLARRRRAGVPFLRPWGTTAKLSQTLR